MKLKDTRTLQERANDLEKVYTFSIVTTAKKYYGTVDRLKTIYKKIVAGNATPKEQIDFCNLFGHKPTEYRKILGQLNGRRVKITDVTQYFSKWFHYQRHFNKNYKSGKTYAVHGYWYIDFDVLARWWNYEAVVVAKSSFYTARQHKFIDSIILSGKTSRKHVEVEEPIEEQIEEIEIEEEQSASDFNIIADSDTGMYVPTEEAKEMHQKHKTETYDFAKQREMEIAAYQASLKPVEKDELTDEEIMELLKDIDL